MRQPLLYSVNMHDIQQGDTKSKQRKRDNNDLKVVGAITFKYFEDANCLWILWFAVHGGRASEEGIAEEGKVEEFPSQAPWAGNFPPCHGYPLCCFQVEFRGNRCSPHCDAAMQSRRGGCCWVLHNKRVQEAHRKGRQQKLFCNASNFPARGLGEGQVHVHPMVFFPQCLLDKHLCKPCPPSHRGL